MPFGKVNVGSQPAFDKSSITPEQYREGFLKQKAFEGESRGTTFLKESIDRGRAMEGRGEALSRQHEANVGDISRRQEELRNAANFAAQTKGGFQFGGGPRGFSRQLTQAERRGRARQDINQRGEATLKNQQLKDRLALIKQSMGKRGRMMAASGDAAKMKEFAATAEQDAADRVGAARTGMFGALAGGAIRGFGDKLFNTGDLGKGIMAQQREVDSYLNTGFGKQAIDDTFGGGFDFGSVQPQPPGLV